MIQENHKQDLNTYIKGEQEKIKEVMDRAYLKKKLEEKR